MSALTDLFTSMANKIRSKVGGSQTYTPLQMVSAIDDVYNAGAASVSPTSITPSNASPVALTANTAVKPTAAGYAIESYSAVNPTVGGTISVSSGSIYKMGANGVVTGIIDNLTSSANGTPITGLRIYKSINGGYAYSTKPVPAPDFFYCNYGSSSSTTYTFTDDYDYVYITTPRNDVNALGTYTGTGTLTEVTSSSYMVVVKIINVNAGDTYKTPAFSISGNGRYMYAVIGKTA